MYVTNAVIADQGRAEAFFAEPDTGPFVMVNLLKFKPRAEYADGSEPDLSGAEAYARYGAAVQKLIAKAGGRIVYGGAVTGLMLGDVEELWDSVGLVEYPSLAAFEAMLTSPEYRAIEHHRKAGLAGQLNIRTQPTASL